MNYDSIAKTYDKRYKNEMCQKENLAVISLLNKYITAGKKVLDLGCGTGFCKECVNAEIDYFGYDTSDKMLLEARNKLPTATLVLGGIDDVKEQDFDIITSLFSLPYIDNGQITNVFNLLKSQGLFIGVYYHKPYLNQASVYHKRKLYYKLFIQPKTKRLIKELKKVGFTIDEGFLTNDRTYKYIVIEC